MRVIARLAGMDHNKYSGRRILRACHGSEVVGIVAGLTGAERRRSAGLTGKEWGRALGLRGIPRALWYGPKLERTVTRDLADDEYYITVLSVAEHSRGKGIGSRLLLASCRDHLVAVTDVNITNTGAVRFYQRHDFVIQKEMTFPHKGTTLGNYQMRRIG